MTTGLLLVATIGLVLALALGLGVATALFRWRSVTVMQHVTLLEEVGAVVHVLERIAVVLERHDRDHDRLEDEASSVS
jgi:hypothetical protein